jgi:hypothetical protein
MGIEKLFLSGILLVSDCDMWPSWDEAPRSPSERDASSRPSDTGAPHA